MKPLDRLIRFDAKLLDQWLAALRSGKYKRSTKTLVQEYRGETRYCCLGVLGKVVGYSDKYMDGKARLPNTGSEMFDVLQSQCIQWNDDQQYSFPTIATRVQNWIKKNRKDFE